MAVNHTPDGAPTQKTICLVLRQALIDNKV